MWTTGGKRATTRETRTLIVYPHSRPNEAKRGHPPPSFVYHPRRCRPRPAPRLHARHGARRRRHCATVHRHRHDGRRHDPSVFIFGGATLTGSLHGKPVSVLNTYEAAGAVMTGAMAAEELDALERAAVLTFGACPGQFTANTMGMVSEILGLAPLGSSIIPAGVRGARAALARSAGQLVMRLLKEIPRSGADCSAPC